ncbi:class I SAM-dependent methyltransferase, partial [Streptomyces sp. NPDC051016]|uniref:class I SAM-dependent methyltransferase n=1 Tax=Streptomyces sp. NPDC051016 TaxID=3365638 RepID=UPI0037A10682
MGGGSGAHAEWLAADGYTVDLVDPVPLHVAQAARLPGVTARSGDARDLPAAAAYDVVLLLGPLHHLPERPDRVRAPAEARRAVRPGGVVVAATVDRYAALHDLLHEERCFEPVRRGVADAVSEDGRPASQRDGSLFTTASLARPAETPAEFAEAGPAVDGRYGVEGVARLMGGVEEWLADPGRRGGGSAAPRRHPEDAGTGGWRGGVGTPRRPG